jgi:hypothetical protein
VRTITKVLLGLNGVLLLFIVLWLLVGGGNRGYFGGGAATEVDGVLLLFLGAFNVLYLAAVFFALPGPAPAPAQAAVQQTLSHDVFQGEQRFHGVLRSWSLWALCINGVLILFVGLWLLVSSGRWGYFLANATEVDMILLLFLSLCNIAYMGLAYLRFSRPVPA